MDRQERIRRNRRGAVIERLKVASRIVLLLLLCCICNYTLVLSNPVPREGARMQAALHTPSLPG